MFLGTAALGDGRREVAAAVGPVGASSGFGMVGSLAAGTYDLVVFAHSAATGTFNQAVRLIVQ